MFGRVRSLAERWPDAFVALAFLLSAIAAASTAWYNWSEGMEVAYFLAVVAASLPLYPVIRYSDRSFIQVTIVCMGVFGGLVAIAWLTAPQSLDFLDGIIGTPAGHIASGILTALLLVPGEAAWWRLALDASNWAGLTREVSA